MTTSQGEPEWGTDTQVDAVAIPLEPASQQRADAESKPPSSLAAPPDGGYGWIVCICQFFITATTWGVLTSFGVFLSFYRVNNFFPGATDLEYAFIAGLCMALPLLISPLSNHLSNRFGVKVPMFIGVVLQVLSQVFAGLSTTIWQLFLTQAVMSGLGIGLIWLPTIPILAQWFSKRRALALGLATSGSGGGSLFFSLVTRASIQSLGLRWAFIINAFVCLAVLVPSVLLMKIRTNTPSAVFKLRDLHYFRHAGFSWVLLWTFCILMGSTITIVSVPTYATAGLGLSQAQGASLQAIMAASQIVGRPLVGQFMDHIGRVNGTSLITFVGGLSCLVVWMFARSYGVLVFFAIVQGMTGGIFWSACGPVCAEVVGLGDMSSAMAILWLAGVIPCMFSEAIGISLADYSQTQLQRTGADVYLVSIGFSGACFVTASILILGAKRHLQGNWRIWQKS